MNFKDCAALLKSKDNILILTHKNPDGDTLGSAGALCSALMRAGRTAWLFRNPDVTDKYMPYVQRFFAPADFKPAYVVAVDVATDGMLATGFEGDVDFCIDHHPTNSHYARRDLVRAEKAACGESILEIIRCMNGGLTKEEATLLYLAVSTDTGCFQYSNTNAETFRAASKLLEYGADNVTVNTNFFRKVSAARLKLEGMIFSNLDFYRGGKIAVATVTLRMLEEAGAKEDDLDDLASLPGKVEGSIVNITIREKAPGVSKISVRTTEEVSSSEICAVFGGGGHAMASGCTINEGPEKAKEMLIQVVNEVWK